MKISQSLSIMIAGVILAYSCRDTPLQPQVPPDYSGMYSDTFSYSHPTNPALNIRDTVIDKRLYKINDSVYLMQRFTCTDTSSLNSCSPFLVYTPTINHVYAFKIRTDNTQEFYNYSLFPLIPYNYNTGYFVPPDFFT
jgi:hypothetical protein